MTTRPLDLWDPSWDPLPSVQTSWDPVLFRPHPLVPPSSSPCPLVPFPHPLLSSPHPLVLFARPLSRPLSRPLRPVLEYELPLGHPLLLFLTRPRLTTCPSGNSLIRTLQGYLNPVQSQLEDPAASPALSEDIQPPPGSVPYTLNILHYC